MSEHSGMELIISLLNAAKREREERSNGGVSVSVGGDAPHEDKDCKCPACRLSRFELPLAAQGDELNEQIIEALKNVHRSGDGSIEGGKKTTVELVLQPLSPEAEQAILQFRLDRLAACARAEKALIALLPEHLQPPADYAHQPVSLEKAQEMLAEARQRTLTQLESKRAIAESIKVAADAVSEVIQAKEPAAAAAAV